MSSQKIALITLIIASIFWSSGGVTAKTLLVTFDPIAVGAIRLTLASIIILPFFLYSTPILTKKLVLDILPISLFSTGNFLFFLFGINKTTANASVIIYTITPIAVAILSYVLIGEKISKQKISGVLLGLVGVLTIILLPIVEKGHVIVGDVKGNLLIIGAMIMFSLYNVGTRYLIANKSYSPITITSISLFISAIIFDLLLLFIPHTTILPSIFTPHHLLWALYFAIFVTVVPYVFHQWAIKHSSATTGALTTYIQPIFGFIINGILLGEIITGGFLFGSILVFSGTFIATGAQMIRMMRKE